MDVDRGTSVTTGTATSNLVRDRFRIGVDGSRSEHIATADAIGGDDSVYTGIDLVSEVQRRTCTCHGVKGRSTIPVEFIDDTRCRSCEGYDVARAATAVVTAACDDELGEVVDIDGSTTVAG